MCWKVIKSSAAVMFFLKSMRLMSLLSEASKNKPIHFLVSVPLVLSQYLWSQTGVTGQCRVNRTDIQPCSVWGWVTVFKLQLGAKRTFRNLSNKHIPSRHLRIPKRTHLLPPQPKPHYEIMCSHWLWTSVGLGLHLAVILQLAEQPWSSYKTYWSSAIIWTTAYITTQRMELGLNEIFVKHFAHSWLNKCQTSLPQRRFSVWNVESA